VRRELSGRWGAGGGWGSTPLVRSKVPLTGDDWQIPHFDRLLHCSAYRSYLKHIRLSPLLTGPLVTGAELIHFPVCSRTVPPSPGCQSAGFGRVIFCWKKMLQVRFQVLMAAILKRAVFRVVVAPIIPLTAILRYVTTDYYYHYRYYHYSCFVLITGAISFRPYHFHLELYHWNLMLDSDHCFRIFYVAVHDIWTIFLPLFCHQVIVSQPLSPTVTESLCNGFWVVLWWGEVH
jgi:hypothetical protein